MTAFAIRPMQAGDWPLIADSWVATGAKTAHWLPMAVFRRLHKKAMSQALSWGSVVYVACLADAPERVVAWCCGDPCAQCRKKPQPLLHWIYVREGYRGLGLAHKLLMELAGDAGCKLTATGWSQAGARLFKASELIDNYRPDLWGRKVQ